MSPPASHARLRAVLCQPEPPAAPRFQPALPAHLERALDVAAHFMALANATPGEAGLLAIAEDAERRAREGHAEETAHALRIFLAHHPEGRDVPVPPLEERAPHQVLSSRRPEPPRKAPPGLPGAEVWVDYFREDAGLNDMLDTWRVRFPAAGHPDPAEPSRRVRPARRTERYWHAHRQLLARYDTERLAFGMHRVAPLQDYTAPLNEGYDSRLPGFAPRPPGVSLQGLPGYDIADHATRRDRLFAGASSGLLWHGDTPLDLEHLEQLADTAESTPDSLDGEAWREPLGPHGAFHHMGQVMLANLRAPRDTSGRLGVLGNPATAGRDPLFYRWHRHVDDLLDSWQCSHLLPHDLSDAPPVLLRKWIGEGPYPAHQSPDILLCFEKDMPGADAPDFDGQRWGEATFGGEHWDKPPPSFFVSTHTLRTHLGQHAVRLPDGTEAFTPRLVHEPFAYFLRVENTLERAHTVTVRLHLVADAFADDRRLWMELDRFVHTLGPRERAVIHRPSRLSSVVHELGWPAHLLLPRGRREGMLFRLQMMVTDTALEAREEGYPFNRLMPRGQRPVDLLALPHVVTRNIWIHHVE
ncbi:tyrosinase family protein [Archangium primigenium]|uniref:tyrosinase family protein n=1 Tax=[Archangium] primigenium TaxID=2792470 RepID=UPI00195B4A88|nr:tyrosinase family protein [Archangium primigenium]